MRHYATVRLAVFLCTAAPAVLSGQGIDLRTELPRTLVYIQEPDTGGTATRDVIGFLREANFPLIDAKLVHTVEPRLVQDALQGNADAALRLGRAFGAHVLIVGTATLGGADEQVSRTKTVTVDVELRAIRLDVGDVVSSERARTPGRGSTAESAGSSAIRAAVLQILQETPFIGTIAENWTRVPWSSQDYFAPGAGSFPIAAPTPVSAPTRMSEKWAVIIGISDYQAEEIADVRSAARDAQALHDLLRSSAAGPFERDHILLLTDSLATGQAMRAALFAFLQNANPEDQVLIYFAGHGGSDPTRPDNVYLLPHDADVTRLAATGFPLWDLKTALRHHLKAERVIVIADAAHAGGTPEPANPIHGALTDLFAPSRGLVLTASGPDELSHEAGRSDTGLGAFTYNLIQGLSGAADQDDNDLVTFAEVSDYVVRRVRTETSGRQSPQRFGSGDLTLTRVTLISRASARLK